MKKEKIFYQHLPRCRSFGILASSHQRLYFCFACMWLDKALRSGSAIKIAMAVGMSFLALAVEIHSQIIPFGLYISYLSCFHLFIQFSIGNQYHSENDTTSSSLITTTGGRFIACLTSTGRPKLSSGNSQFYRLASMC